MDWTRKVNPVTATKSELDRQPKLPGNIFRRFGFSGHQQKLKFENLALFSLGLIPRSLLRLCWSGE